MITFPYMPTSHDSAFDEVFPASNDTFNPDADPVACLMIAFVNRSGSNHVADAIKTTGLVTGLEEMFNDNVVRSLSRRYGSKSASDYVRRIAKEQVTQPGQIWGVKAGGAQIAMLLRRKIVPALLSPLIVRVKRRDILGQAISLLIAEQTQQWTSQDKRADVVVGYDAQRIVHHIRGISNSYALIDQIIATVGLPTFDVIYEEFLDRPHYIVSKLTQSLLGQAATPDLTRLSLHRQGDGTNSLFRSRFLAEMGDIAFQTA